MTLLDKILSFAGPVLCGTVFLCVAVLCIGKILGARR